MKKGILKKVLFFSGMLVGSVCLAGSQKLDQDKVKNVVRKHLTQVQRCYTDLIIEGMAAKGKVVATWDIDDKGAVQNLEIKENTSESSALAGCVSEHVVKWTFPEAEAGKTFPVTYPFQFGN